MSYTLGTAAKATGKSKSTIKRALEKGLISAEKSPIGEWIIDPAELHRVYPPSNGGTGPDSVPEGTGRNGGAQARLAVLEREAALLREMLDREREQSQAQLDDIRRDRDHWRQQATALLTDGREKAPQKPVEGRLSRAWLILRGRS